MKKTTINSATITLNIMNNAITMHQVTYVRKGTECLRIDSVTLHWVPGDEWFPARWLVCQHKGQDCEVCEIFDSLPKAFRLFKSLLK